MREKKLFLTLIWLLAFCACNRASAQSQPQPEDGAQQFATLGDFKLQSGTVVHDFRIGYRIVGNMNADKSNVILWPTMLGGRTEDLLQYIGPERVIDNSKYFVILVDSLGNGISTSPSNSTSQPGMKFPRFTIRDMV